MEAILVFPYPVRRFECSSTIEDYESEIVFKPDIFWKR